MTLPSQTHAEAQPPIPCVLPIPDHHVDLFRNVVHRDCVGPYLAPC